MQKSLIFLDNYELLLRIPIFQIAGFDCLYSRFWLKFIETQYKNQTSNVKYGKDALML